MCSQGWAGASELRNRQGARCGQAASPGDGAGVCVSCAGTSPGTSLSLLQRLPGGFLARGHAPAGPCSGRTGVARTAFSWGGAGAAGSEGPPDAACAHGAQLGTPHSLQVTYENLMGAGGALISQARKLRQRLPPGWSEADRQPTDLVPAPPSPLYPQQAQLSNTQVPKLMGTPSSETNGLPVSLSQCLGEKLRAVDEKGGGSGAEPTPGLSVFTAQSGWSRWPRCS